MKQHVLIIEDDRTLNAGISFALEKEGYAVHSAHSLQEAEKCLERKMSLILLDVNLPDGDGRDFLRNILAGQPVPVICLTALDTEEDMLQGFRAGCDDYVTKPFGMMELVSRIKAVLRRSGKMTDNMDLELHGVRVNVKKHEVTVDGNPVTLTLKEFELLERLMQNCNIVLTRDRLLEDIWGYDFDGETRTVDVHVRTLRQKLGEKGAMIETVRGVGYRIGEDYAG